jgi:excisionase family DNA binding protein
MHVSGLGRTRLYEAMAAGDLASCKVGRRRLILLEDLHAWLARQRHPAIRDMPTAPAIRPPASAGKATRARTEIGR